MFHAPLFSPMPVRKRAIVFGGCERERAAFCHALGLGDWHIEPVRDVAELIALGARAWDALIVWRAPRLVRVALTTTSDWLPQVPVIVCAPATAASEAFEAINAGASGVLEWPATADDLTDLVDRIKERDAFLLDVKDRARRARRHLDRLTPRELEIMILVAQGMSNRDIAQHLGISYRTVEIHRFNALTSLALKSSALAMQLIHEAGLARPLAPAGLNGQAGDCAALGERVIA